MWFSIAFSAFDRFAPVEPPDSGDPAVLYNYVGLKHELEPGSGKYVFVSPDHLRLSSLIHCKCAARAASMHNGDEPSRRCTQILSSRSTRLNLFWQIKES